MELVETYRRLTRAIVKEHEAVFAMLDMAQLSAFVDAITAADNVLLRLGGRESRCALRDAAFPTGKRALWLFDDTTRHARGRPADLAVGGATWAFTAICQARHERAQDRDGHRASVGNLARTYRT
jgi:hypothetical protein